MYIHFNITSLKIVPTKTIQHSNIRGDIYMNRDEEFQTRILICEDCEEEFCFTVEAQEYLARIGHMYDPKRCKSCHRTFKKGQRNNDHQPGTRPSH